MFEWLLPLLGVGGTVASAAGQSSANAQNQQQFDTAMANNNLQAEAQRQWASSMSSTAYQRATQDMRAAGINPMLAYMQGGASTPSGASASTGVGNAAQNPMGAMASAGFEVARYNNERKSRESQMSLNEAMKDNARADAVLKSNNARTAVANAEMAEAQLPAVREQAQLDREKAVIDRRWLNYDSAANRARREAGTISNAVDAVTGGLGRAVGGVVRGARGGGKRYTEDDMIEASKGHGVLIR